MDMTFKQYFPITVMIAIIAFFLVLVNLLFTKVIFAGGIQYFVMWIAFQAWAMYFMNGCNPTGGMKVFIGYLGGTAASIAIMTMGGWFKCLGDMATPVAVLIVVVPVICAGRVPIINCVPAWFVGAGVFFGLKTHIPNLEHSDAAMMNLLSCLVGLIFGWITIVCQGKYEAWLAAKLATEAAAPAPAEAPAAEVAAEEAGGEE